ncbi:sugar ABC transporter ATP-binding protein [Parapedobacter sp. 10938]|uniref:sugar ABC transporter ATP-binding protein n=1 Tax=Parapedobacter flavus TaxID=3110225 RepID=UPI002DBAD870|nr:sugar ABC transporter ATP-binding protein [Parapedobacter sp. 10938]MEC3878120.1 sugar ABC transporter ATP-binding protein [Parapedobacter sp. 10938]
MLVLKKISKSFGGVRALEDVDLSIRKGEIHALLGENGAGKSTLMKVISGAHKADSGQIIIDGQIIDHNDPHVAKTRGISIIYQEFSLIPELSVSENILFGSGEGKGWLNRKKMDNDAAALIHSLGFDIDVKKRVAQLSVAQQQIVEIAKALSQDVKLLILDEPSAVLGTKEVKKLFSLLYALRKKGVSVIYISHHLEELLELTDRVTVLKDGRTVTTLETSAVDKDRLVNLMVGRELTQLYPEKLSKPVSYEKIVIDKLYGNDPQPISFEIRKGEILGLGGLVGAGRTEILESLFGLSRQRPATLQWKEQSISYRTPREAIYDGWGMVPEDRKKHGGILDLSIRDNISLTNLSQIANRWGFINHRKEEKIVRELISRLRIKIGDVHHPLATLSGGNQQKVVLGKWLNRSLHVLLIDEPTRGVDVGARSEIYQIIQQLADQGMYIVMVSSDMEELMGMSDRIMVIKNGMLQGTVGRSDFSEEKILRMAIGAN